MQVGSDQRLCRGDVPRGKNPWLARDNVCGAHPQVVSAINAATLRAAWGELGAYGNDVITRNAVNILRGYFGTNAEAYFGPTGTFVNILGCSLLGRSANILAAPNSHLIIMETNGPETIAGARFIPAKTANGKIDVDAIGKLASEVIEGLDLIHVTQPTEYGTLYTIDELKAIGEFCSTRKVLFGMDGARLSHAAVALKAPLREITTDVGVDYVTLGTAKCGGFNGNALIIPDRARTEAKGNCLYTEPRLYELIKQRGGTQSMMWQITSQFEELYKADLWRDIASQALNIAWQIRDELKKSGVETAFPAETNAIFLTVGEDGQERLGRYWNFFRGLTDPNLIRFMVPYNTDKELVPILAKDIVELRDAGMLESIPR